jgi:hypothetical protein
VSSDIVCSVFVAFVSFLFCFKSFELTFWVGSKKK